ncbi:DivIVA domain-containing protein [Nocardioides sp. MAHUQ-72]|uniref:DivIVA domain-containing protein n=1 Tax=unclassified Nocardioides TaxID=2615069 RepID=UPI00361B106D
MTSNAAQSPTHHRSSEAIRNESFPRRLRGLDEEKVYAYLDRVADQVQAADDELREVSAENQRLRADLQRARAELAERDEAGDRVNDQVVELFSQAQLVAEEMVEDVSRDARERLEQARERERQILQEAMETAERTRRDAEALIRWTLPGAVQDTGSSSVEVDRVRSFAHAAEAQMQSIVDSLASEVERLGDAPADDLPAGGFGSPGRHRNLDAAREEEDSA